MNLKNIPIKPKKIPFNLTLLLLTVGASLILGFLSFGGMYALLPILPLAFGAFALSVAYEGEIYLQNIKGALNKIFKNNYLKNQLAKEHLLTHAPENTKDEDCPKFFNDYHKQLKLLSAFGHKKLNKESQKRKKQIEKTLRDMDKWFALQLFPDKNKNPNDESDYTKKLRLWLTQNQQEEWQEKLKKRRFHFHLAKAFSVLAGLFMGLGSTYLIVEAFTVIPLFAAIPFAFWPILILPMAIIAGVAYGMLTYNAVTDMINNNTVLKWYYKIRDELSKGLTVRNVFIATTAVLLVGLAIALTVCTAGTWWTVATKARPLYEWMKKMPSFIMGVINPIITGLSSLVFNIQNSAESLDMIDEATRSKKNVFQQIYDYFIKSWNHIRATENWLQIFNPFRIILKLIVTPLRILLFLGHLISIALTADRMPGVPQVISMLIAIINEGFEDAHYFVGFNQDHEEEEEKENEHKHAHKDFKSLLKEHLDPTYEHDHNMDIPTWTLKTLASPIYALAALWDSLASKLNHSVPADETQPRILFFRDAWNKQRGIPEEENVELAQNAKHPSANWQVEHAVAQIDKYEAKHLKGTWIGRELANDKIIELHQLKEKICKPQNNETLAETLNLAKHQAVYNKHRLFTQSKDKTTTQEFIEELSNRVNVAPSH